MKWRPFTYQGTTYDLSHLHAFEWQFVLPAKGDNPEKCYFVDVRFSLHTFTKGIAGRAAADRQLLYRDSREVRAFDFERYELSKRLPGIVRSLGERKCHHTNYGNFFTVDLVEENAQKRSYEVYFTVSRSEARRGQLRLLIWSAYERTQNHGAPPKNKPIRFHVIVHNTLHKKLIKVPHY